MLVLPTTTTTSAILKHHPIIPSPSLVSLLDWRFRLCGGKDLVYVFSSPLTPFIVLFIYIHICISLWINISLALFIHLLASVYHYLFMTLSPSLSLPSLFLYLSLGSGIYLSVVKVWQGILDFYKRLCWGDGGGEGVSLCRPATHYIHFMFSIFGIKCRASPDC